MNHCDRCGPTQHKVHYVDLLVDFAGTTDHSQGTWCVPCLRGMMRQGGYGRSGKSTVLRVTKLVPMTKEDWEEK